MARRDMHVSALVMSGQGATAAIGAAVVGRLNSAGKLCDACGAVQKEENHE